MPPKGLRNQRKSDGTTRWQIALVRLPALRFCLCLPSLQRKGRFISGSSRFHLRMDVQNVHCDSGTEFRQLVGTNDDIVVFGRM